MRGCQFGSCGQLDKEYYLELDRVRLWGGFGLAVVDKWTRNIPHYSYCVYPRGRQTDQDYHVAPPNTILAPSRSPLGKAAADIYWEGNWMECSDEVPRVMRWVPFPQMVYLTNICYLWIQAAVLHTCSPLVPLPPSVGNHNTRQRIANADCSNCWSPCPAYISETEKWRVQTVVVIR